MKPLFNSVYSVQDVLCYLKFYLLAQYGKWRKRQELVVICCMLACVSESQLENLQKTSLMVIKSQQALHHREEMMDCTVE